MKCTICFLCKKSLLRADRSFDGGYVEFAEYVEPEVPDDPCDMWLDEPPGFEQFCGEHLAAAQALSHLTSKEAMLQLEQQFGKFEDPYSPEPPRTRWQRLCDWWKWV